MVSNNMLKLFPWRNLQKLCCSILIAVLILLLVELFVFFGKDGGILRLFAQIFLRHDSSMYDGINKQDYKTADALHKKFRYKEVCSKHFCTVAKNQSIEFYNHKEIITVVTAYFNLGSFQKGNTSKTYTTGLYYTWGKAISLVMNNMIVFTDDKQFLKESWHLRDAAGLRTCFCYARRSKLFSFRLVPVIAEILKQPGYPKHHPNTVMPEYGATMHAKYDVMHLALDWNPFKASCYTWMDVGIFRDLVNYTVKGSPTTVQTSADLSAGPFFLDPPPNWDRNRVAVNQVGDVYYNMTVKDYFIENSVWIGGGFFMATREVMYQWIKQYQRALSTLLAMGLTNTDQQVLYAMFHPSMLRNIHVHPQISSIVYPQNYRKQEVDKVNEWFYLPFLCRKQWFMRVNHITCTPTLLDLKECLRLSNATSKSSASSASAFQLSSIFMVFFFISIIPLFTNFFILQK